MCGRYSLIADAQALIDFFEVSHSIIQSASWRPRYNIAPGQDLPVIRQSEQGKSLDALHWGLIPPWSDCSHPKISPINARAETVRTKPMFRRAFARRRCLIPATGFYEWAKTPEGKQPYYFSVKDSDLFAFAGIWERCQPASGQPIDSYSIIVTSANQLVHPIHDRMPVILRQEDYDAWLDTGDAGALEQLLKPYPPDQMDMRPANPCVNNARNDSPECLE